MSDEELLLFATLVGLGQGYRMVVTPAVIHPVTTTAQTPENGPGRGLGAPQGSGLVSGVTDEPQGREKAKWTPIKAARDQRA